MSKRKKRSGFTFYRSFYEALSELSDEQRLKLYDVICGYALDRKKPPKFEGLEKLVWTLIAPNLDANFAKFLNGCEGGRFGYLGGRPRKKTPKPEKENRSGVKSKNPSGVPKQNPNEDVDADEDVDVDGDSNQKKSTFNFDSLPPKPWDAPKPAGISETAWDNAKFSFDEALSRYRRQGKQASSKPGLFRKILADEMAKWPDPRSMSKVELADKCRELEAKLIGDQQSVPDEFFRVAAEREVKWNS